MTHRTSARWRMLAVVATGIVASACTGTPSSPTPSSTTPEPTTAPSSPVAATTPSATDRSRTVCLHHEKICFEVPTTWRSAPGDVEDEATQDYMLFTNGPFVIEVRTGIKPTSEGDCIPTEPTTVTAFDPTPLTIPRRDERGGPISVAQFHNIAKGQFEVHARLAAGVWPKGTGTTTTCAEQREAPIYSPRRDSTLIWAGLKTHTLDQQQFVERYRDTNEYKEAIAILKSVSYQ